MRTARPAGCARTRTPIALRTYHCSRCHQQVFHENVLCERCDAMLGFIEDAGELSAFEPWPDGSWRALAPGVGEVRYRQCHNYAVEHVCNRMIPLDDPATLCRSCRLTAVIPSLSEARNRALWYQLERAKRRLLYTLNQLELPVVSRDEDPETGLVFEFLADAEGAPKVHTGHDDGLITINIAEADDAHRARVRAQMKEPYRTLLGHFRHEIGHYYFLRLMTDSPLLDDCRALFGDDREDYGEAMKRHYANGAPDDWQASYISAYATMHPYEDWAETWAHYMHMVDTLETASACGLHLAPPDPTEPSMTALDVDRVTRSFNDMIARWFPLTYALNSLNRSMGMPDTYPFTLGPPVIEKLRFVHRVIKTQGEA